MDYEKGKFLLPGYYSFTDDLNVCFNENAGDNWMVSLGLLFFKRREIEAVFMWGEIIEVLIKFILLYYFGMLLRAMNKTLTVIGEPSVLICSSVSCRTLMLLRNETISHFGLFSAANIMREWGKVRVCIKKVVEECWVIDVRAVNITNCYGSVDGNILNYVASFVIVNKKMYWDVSADQLDRSWRPLIIFFLEVNSMDILTYKVEREHNISGGIREWLSMLVYFLVRCECVDVHNRKKMYWQGRDA